MKFIWIIFFFLLFLLGPKAFANEAQLQFEQGNQAYQSGRYEQSIQHYEAALQSGFESPALLANLGSAYFRKKQYGKAILNYEKGLLLDPNAADISQNLDQARKSAGLETPDASNTFFLSRWWQSLRSAMSPNAWAYMALVLCWLLLSGVWLGWLRPDVSYSKWAKGAFYALLPLFLMAFVLAQGSAVHAIDSKEAIITVNATPVYADPDKTTEVIENLQEGSKVYLDEQISDWWKIRLQTGEEAWIEAGKGEKI